MNALERLKARAARARRVLDAPDRPPKTPQAAALEAKGYEPWAMKLGSRTFKHPFSPFHHRFWRWYWPARMKLLAGERLTLEEMTALLIWGRGLGKSSHVEWACIAEGALSEGVTDEPGFVGYVCADADLAKGHVQSIRTRLDSPEIAFHYPGLANPHFDKRGVQTAWRQDKLVTASGWGIIPIGLREGVRGGRLDEVRFSMFVFDDVDSRRYGADVVRKNLDIIAHEILPAGTPQTLNLFPQNLVIDYGVLSQILSRETDVMSDRTVIGDEAGEPQPAFEDVELVLDDRLPGVYRIRSATPVWQGFDRAAADKFLSNSGRAAFMAEYQHRLDVDRRESVLPHFRDEVHVVTRSEFKARYGFDTIPAKWGSRWFNDWAQTKSAKHANVAGRISVSSQNSAVPGVVVLSDCMSFEPGTGADEVAVSILKALSPQGAPVGSEFRPWPTVFRDSFVRTNVSAYTESLTDRIEAERDVRAHILQPVVREVLKRAKYPQFRGSHEQENNALRVYRKVYGLPFKATNPGKEGGLELLNSVMLVDRSKPHAFKPDKKGEDGLYWLGFTRFHIIVEDAEAAPPPANVNPKGLHGSQLARYQLRRWRHLPVADTTTGEVERGPEKRNDDFGNGLQFVTHDGLPPAASLTQDEMDEESLHPNLRWETVSKITDPAIQSAAITSRQMQLEGMRRNREERFDARRTFRTPRVRFRR
ncbi:MAG: hypothetical protein ACJ754_10970 [Pyrinomonadaceae bacterium]